MNLVVCSYLVVLILAILAMCRLLYITKNQRAPYFVGLFMQLIVVAGSYVVVSTARTAEEALLATKFTYLDGTFVILFLMLGMCQICNIRLPKWLLVPMIIVDFEVMTVVFMAGHNTLHYESYSLVHKNGLAIFTKEYGPHHTFYLIFLVLGMLFPIGIIVHAAIKKTASWIYILLLSVGEFMTIVLYLVERAIKYDIELIPFGFIISEYLILFILERISLYDTSNNIQLSIVRSNDLGFVILDNKLHFISADDVARRFFPELNGLLIDREIHDEFFCSEFSDWVTESREVSVKPKYYIRDGVDVKVTVQPLFDNSGKKQIGYLMQISNDSQNQEYIRELKEVNAKANEMALRAEKANSAKSDFLSNMSHEIRTPMNAVLGMNEMIMRESTNPQILEYASNIENSGRMLLSIINDILDFSKIEAGKMDIINVDYNVSELLNDLDNMNRPRAEGKNLKFEIRADESIPKFLNGDNVRIKQVITNLVNNAIKYTESGSVSVEVRADRTSGNQVGLFIGVKDTGKGIREEDQKKLFKSFQRIDEKSNRSIEGTGLGLAITEGFVRLMGGQIGVNSEFGKGSLFYVTIPQTIVKDEPIGDYRASLHADKRVIKDYKESFTAPDARVLIVDDTSINIVVFKGLLKKTGVNIDTALSGEDGLKLCKSNKYDIIFLDHMMPEMDGMEVLNYLKSSEYDINKDTPKIALTANAVAGSREMYLEAGFSDYLSKPMNPEELEQMMIKYIPEDKIK